MKSFKWLLIFLAVAAATLAIAFWVIAKPGHSVMEVCMVLTDMLPAAILMACALYLKSRLLAGLSIVTAFFALLLKFGAIVLYKESFMAVTYESLTLLLEHTNHEGVKAMVGEHYYIWAPLAALAILMLIACCVRIAVRYVTAVRTDKIPWEWNDRCLWHVLMFVLWSLICNGLYVYFHDVNTRIEENYVGHVVTPMHVLCKEIFDDFCKAELRTDSGEQYGYKLPQDLPQKQLKRMEELGLLPQKNQSGENRTYPQFDRIVIVAIESLDSDFLGSSGNPKIPADLTPNIDRMQRENFAFHNYWSSSQPTSWGLTSLILGRPDYKLDKKLKSVSLCDLLRQQGYTSYYFSPIRGEFGDNRKVFRKMFRFDHMIFEEELRRDYPYVKDAGGWGLSDESMYRAALDFLHREKPQKYLLLISTMDSHNPYHASGPVAAKKNYEQDFHNSIHGVDDNIGRFVQEFTSDPQLYNDRTLLIVTADHSACHGKNYSTRDYLPKSAKIPLIFISKCDFEKYGFRKDTMFTTMDLAADLVRFIGVPDVPETFMGQLSRAKKPFALTRNMEDVITLFLPNGKDIGFDKNHPVLKTHDQEVLFNYYRIYYPNLTK